MNQEFKLKDIDETRNCFFEETEQNELSTKAQKGLHNPKLY